jgi:hypothetical protein
MARDAFADLEAVLGGGVALARETATPILGAGRYINDRAYGSEDASNAMDWARSQTEKMRYTPSPEGQQAQQEMLQSALSGGKSLYESGFAGIKPIAESGTVQKIGRKVANWWDDVSPDVKAGLEMASGGLDVINPMMAGGVGLAMKATRGADMVSDALSEVGPKTRQASKLADELDVIKNQRAALQDYHNDVDFIQADTIDYTIDERLGKRKKTGQYRGAPRNVTSPQKLGKMRKELTRLLEAGAPGRLWYDESTEAAKQLTGGAPRNKRLYAGTTAITSRGAAVPSNQLFGVKGFNQLQVGDQAKAGRFPNAQGEAIDELGSGRPYEGGPKETPFYEGLTIDERADGVRPTNDLWMARAFDYTTPEGELWAEGLGQAQHRFMDNELNALVETANKGKIGGFDDWTPERVQAAIWVAKKAEMEGTDIAKASQNFKDNLDNLTADIRYETRPSTSLDHLGEFGKTDDYQDLVDSVLQNEAGQDLLSLQAGGLTRPSARGYGEYEGVTSPSTGMRVMAAPETGQANIDSSSERLVNALAAGRGLTGGQDTVGTTFLRPAKKGFEKNAARVDMGGAPGKDEMAVLNARLNEEFGGDVFAVHSASGVEILNESGVDTKAFQKGVKNVLKGQAEPEFMHNSGGLVGNTYWDEAGGTPGYKPSRYIRDIDAQDLGPEAMKRLEGGLMDEASTWNKVDALIEREIPEAGKRDELLTMARDILSTKGLQGVRDAVKKGILPTVVLSAVSAQLLPEPQTDVGQS